MCESLPVFLSSESVIYVPFVEQKRMRNELPANE